MTKSESIVIPGFQIRRKIGQGGMGAVYLAEQLDTQELVALKIVSRTQHDDRDTVRRFLRESAIVAELGHPSIVPASRAGTVRDHHFFAMELLSGGSLRERLRSGERGEALARRVGLSIASALDAVHRMGFLHRDVKPSNILFRDDGTPVLTDFGLARKNRALHKLTAAGVVVGTPSYMSPEQVADTKLDGRSDLYSLGIVFYEVLTGVVPFSAETVQALSRKHRDEAMPLLPARYAAYQSFLDRLTAKDRQHRFATAAEVAAALESIPPVGADMGEVIDAMSGDGATVPEKPRVRVGHDTTVMRSIPLDEIPRAQWTAWVGIGLGALVAAIAYFLFR